MNELISVIIPVYNASSYLENCIDSILNQTYTNLEIIIVDDGSIDGSEKIADLYAERFPDIIKCFHQKNSGVTTARINGIIASSGEWIGFVDADDEIEPDMYERLMANALKYDAAISHCGHKTIVNGGERIHYFYNTGRLSVQDKEDALKDLLIGVFEPGLWTKIYRRSIVFEVINKDKVESRIKYNEDLLMNYYLFSRAHTSVFEDFCSYHYMARNDSATRGRFRIEIVVDPVKVSKIILDSVSSSLKKIALHNYLSCCLNAYIALLDKAEYKAQTNELKKVLDDNWKNRYLLRRNERIKLVGVFISPLLFKRFYTFYEKYFQKKIYE